MTTRILSRKKLVKVINGFILIWVGYLLVALVGYQPGLGLITGGFQTFTHSSSRTVVSFRNGSEPGHDELEFSIVYPARWRILVSGYLGLHFHEGPYEQVRFISGIYQPDATVFLEQRFFDNPPTVRKVAEWGRELMQSRFGRSLTVVDDLEMAGDYWRRTYQTKTNFYEDVYVSHGNAGIIIRLETTPRAKSQTREIFASMVDSFRIENSQ